MSKPSGGSRLMSEIGELRSANVGLLVSLLELDEEIESGLSAEEDVCRTNGIQFLSFPIPDFGVPANDETFVEVVHLVQSILRNGENVVVHCAAGIGRSGLLVAGVLAACGIPVSAAFTSIGNQLHREFPETSRQKSWLESRTHLLQRKAD